MDTGQKTESIARLVEDIVKDQVSLPEFQRDFVWDIEKTFDLFDSFVRDIFVGSLIYGVPSFQITVRELDRRPRSGKDARARLKLSNYTLEEIENRIKVSGFRLLLDGQQRATSIYRAMTGVDRVADLRVVDGHPLFAYRAATTRSMQFIMLKDKFNHPRVSVQVDTRENEDGESFFEMVGDGDEIAQKHIGKNWDDWVHWEFDYNKRVVTDGNAIIFKVLRDQNEEVIPLKKAELLSHDVTELFAAFAQPTQSSGNIADLPTFVRDLMDGDPVVRRNARDSLIAFGSIAVAPMLEAWHKNPDNFKLKLGVVIVMNNMLRTDENIRDKISGNLKNDDIPLLVGALSDSDQTVRLQATEFLYSLKDMRIVNGSLEAISQNNSNENGLYNNVLILKELVPHLADRERTRVRNEVINMVPSSYVNTRALAIAIDP